MGDGFYRSKDPTNSIKVLKEKAAKEKKTQKKHKEKRKYTHTKKYTNNRYTNKHSKSPSLQYYGVTRGQLPQRAGSLGLNGGGAAVPSSVTTQTPDLPRSQFSDLPLQI